MKIAFTSCASRNLIKTQPIWDDILASQPDHVVLLGDNLYLDVPDFSMAQLQAMGTWEFSEHLFVRYQQQITEQKFRHLVAAPNITLHAIWDDHDFAWNDAMGARLLADPNQAEKVKISINFMRTFRRALANKDLGSFPQRPDAPEFWADWDSPAFTPLGKTSIQLEPDGRAWLHLTDGRTFRKKKRHDGRSAATAVELRLCKPSRCFAYYRQRRGLQSGRLLGKLQPRSPMASERNSEQTLAHAQWRFAR